MKTIESFLNEQNIKLVSIVNNDNRTESIETVKDNVNYYFVLLIQDNNINLTPSAKCTHKGVHYLGVESCSDNRIYISKDLYKRYSLRGITLIIEINENTKVWDYDEFISDILKD